MSNLQEITLNRLVEEIFDKCRGGNKNKWHVLVIDVPSTKVISRAIRMNALTEHGVTVVEKLELNRQPLLNFEAIYFISATEASIDKFISDFDNPSKPLYRGAHVFTLTPLSDDQFKKISSSKAAAFIKTLNEFNLDYLTMEAQSFSLGNNKGTYESYCSPSKLDTARVAEQLASVCFSLKDNAYVGHWKGSTSCKAIAEQTAGLLSTYVKDGDLPSGDSDRGQLVIVDRLQDAITPILHDLHYQPMVYDLLPVDSNDVYTYGSSGKKETRKLGVDDELWTDVRHQHIADTIRKVNTDFQEFKSKNKATDKMKNDTVTAAELQEALQQMPEHQKEVKKYAMHVQTAEECMSKYAQQNLEIITKIEQDLVLGEDAAGNRVSTKDLMPSIIQCLGDAKVSQENRLRLLMTYACVKKGVKAEDLNKLIECANIPQAMRSSIFNLNKVGVKVLNDDPSAPSAITRINRSREGWYADSRWVPVFRDVMEYCLNGQYDKSDIAFIGSKPPASSAKSSGGAASSNRTRTPVWADKKGKKENKSQFSGSRLIIYVNGGLTYSELRHAYEVSKATSRQIIIGSTNMIKPIQFVNSIKNLDKASVSEEDLGY